MPPLDPLKNPRKRWQLGYYQAKVEISRGNRMLSKFMASADLGLVGVGLRETLVIDYKPGTVVTEERVRAAMNQMIRESDRLQTEFVIHHYTVKSVTFIPCPQT